MTLRLSTHIFLYGFGFLYKCSSLLGIARQWSPEKFSILSQSLGVMLEYFNISNVGYL